ncbi:MAG: ribosomal protein S18-alanine N-acetyltransferase [Actinobacteria bacterium]|nr:ribosomal protein S18-alanine N-acetyltransferase [Actinomycetota bacterium]
MNGKINLKELKIVPMECADLINVYAIERSVFSQPWTIGMFVSELRRKDLGIYFVAKTGKKVIGYGGLITIGDEGHIMNLAVDNKFQNQGVGSLLLLNLINAAVKKGAKRLTLEVRKSNSKAQAFYRKFGFSETGIRKEYYHDNKEDAIILWTDDISSNSYRELLKKLKNEQAGE